MIVAEEMAPKPEGSDPRRVQFQSLSLVVTILSSKPRAFLVRSGYDFTDYL